MELWGGLECTINRVGDIYMDQLEYSGHYDRPGDISLIAELGIQKIRYPVLWEKHQPTAGSEVNWSETEKRLLNIREHGMEPIAGLVHHGSGPVYVNMAEESFVNGLADYAKQVASKFPWIQYYTPVNEPLTTARFCGLYGIWYPHGCDDKSFIRILLNECKGTVLAMQEIRKINPHAKLVQTEDLGKIHSTPLLHYQADFENNRRWLTFDLLCGKVTDTHPLYHYLTDNGISKAELSFFADNPCPPDICGFNYYLTSERYLDENIQEFPTHTHGTNGRHIYADVEVLRVGNAQADGLKCLLSEAWDRYKLPLAVTEVHLHCTREEQLRWIRSVWDTGKELEKQNVDIRAITAWSLLGSFGWNKLLTRPEGDYEPGVFDVRGGHPRATVLGKLLRGISAGESFDHPLLSEPGWWERDIRVEYNKDNRKALSIRSSESAPVLMVCNTDTISASFSNACRLRNIHYRILSKQDLQGICLEEHLLQLNPWAVIEVLDTLSDSPASAASKIGKGSHVHLSSLALKSGIKQMYYVPHAEPKPDSPITSAMLNRLIRYKLNTEKTILENNASSLIIHARPAAPKFNDKSIKWQTDKFAVRHLSVEQNSTELFINTALNLLIDDETGVWHLTNRSGENWSPLSSEVA